MRRTEIFQKASEEIRIQKCSILVKYYMRNRELTIILGNEQVIGVT